MTTFANDQSITVDCADSSLLATENPLVRAVMISLFTWRRALPADRAEGRRWGWWADGIEGDPNDRIGSRLWLLAREKITADTLERAREYAQEALQWMVDDRVATAVSALAERYGLDGVALQVTIERAEGGPVTLRFENAWRELNV